MTTRMRCPTDRRTNEIGCIDVAVAWHLDFVLTARDYAFDHRVALDFGRVLVLPAKQLLGMMPAWELDIDVSDIHLAFLITLAPTFVLAIVVTALLDPVAWLQAIHGLMQSLRMALVDTRVSARQALST